jgi:TPR repeat protein
MTVVALSLPLSACLSSLNLAEGIASFKKQNYRQAFIRLLPEANKGNPEAQYAIGYMYYYGQGVTEDREQALKWIRLAALANQPDAIVALNAIKKQPKIVKHFD